MWILFYFPLRVLTSHLVRPAFLPGCHEPRDSPSPSPKTLLTSTSPPAIPWVTLSLRGAVPPFTSPTFSQIKIPIKVLWILLRTAGPAWGPGRPAGAESPQAPRTPAVASAPLSLYQVPMASTGLPPSEVRVPLYINLLMVSTHMPTVLTVELCLQ